MLDIAAELYSVLEQGEDVAVATVVAVRGSAPRQPGATLAVTTGGKAIGSVSGGCVEGAVYELCRQALGNGETVLESFGYSAEDAFAVGLTCGGVIDVLVTPVRADTPVRPVLATALAAAARGEAVALARVVSGPAELGGHALVIRPNGSCAGGFGSRPGLNGVVAAEALSYLKAGHSGTLEIGKDITRCGVPLTLLVESTVPAPRMIVFGAIDVTAALVRAGKFLGYHVTVCDARPVFATHDRFPEADDIVVDWPHRYLRRTEVDPRTVLCVLTHDAKFDIPLLRLALGLPVAYVGAMGSRRTHLDRVTGLRQAGATDPELARLRSPIGLDLGGRTPEETAVAVAAEIIATCRGGSGLPLTGTRAPIHHDVPVRNGSGHRAPRAGRS
ncbi:XdhC family protein [Streptomyces sp. NPDC051784]|uniref:XdhC family protein n=1 Tax=Streptomyces sp. NPDC051784 TaxID=3155805 RepID=UPI0034209F98